MTKRALIGVFAACLLGLATAAWLGTAASAGTSTFLNPAAITINDGGNCIDPGVGGNAAAATPYPSGITVSGLGTVSDVNE